MSSITGSIHRMIDESGKATNTIMITGRTDNVHFALECNRQELDQIRDLATGEDISLEYARQSNTTTFISVKQNNSVSITFLYSHEITVYLDRDVFFKFIRQPIVDKNYD